MRQSEPGQEEGLQKSSCWRKARSTDRSFPTAEVIMKYESGKRSLGNNKAHKKAAVGGRQRVRFALYG